MSKQVRGWHAPPSARRGGLGISASLMASLAASLPPEPRVEKTKTNRRGPPGKEPDDVLLEIRRLHEQRGMSIAAIRAHMAALGISVDLERVRNICNYTTRSHLAPSLNANPYIKP